MATDPSRPNLQVAGRTLLVGGFHIASAIRKPGYVLLRASRTDEFGVVQEYAFAISERGQMTAAQGDAAATAADHYGAHLVLVAEQADGYRSVAWNRFISLFGGPVFSASPLDPVFRDRLVTLGKNELPAGMAGRPDDLFEAHVRVALEFALWGRVIRYGQDRRFEARADGLVLKEDFVSIYDAKAAGGDGYDVTKTTARQFADYVEDFRARYRAFVPRIHSFLVVSTSFKQRKSALVERSRDLHAACGVPLTFITAPALMDIIDMLADYPAARGAVQWSRVMLDVVVDPARVRSELDAIGKDGVVRPSPSS